MDRAATLNAKLDAATVAMEAGDYTTAKARLLEAQVQMVGIPDGAQGASSWRFGRVEVEQLIKQCDAQLQAAATRASGGIRNTKVTYRGAS